MKFWIVLLFIGMGLFANAQEVTPKEGPVTTVLKEISTKDHEKALKKAQKAQKRAEKELKQKERAQDAFDKANKRLEQNQSKFDRLKSKGDLSPNDEAKWLKRLNRYKKDMEKAKKTMLKT